MNVLISGAGIAGPALALALASPGHRIVVVERARELRTGGQAVDFRGAAHRRVLDGLALWDPIHARRTIPRPLAFIDGAGGTDVLLPAILTAGDVEIVRGDLCEILYDRTRELVDYRFGESITELRGGNSEVQVSFSSGGCERFELVVGADGLHSAVRALAFGPERDCVLHHGYCLATWSLVDAMDVSSATLSYAEPGRSITVSAAGEGRVRVTCMFTSDAPDRRWNVSDLRSWIVARFAGAGWETRRLVARVEEADDLYADSLATVRLDHYVRGRIALLGDAAWGGTIGGQGTGLAVVGAWVLARELAASRHDIGAALGAFEARMRPYANGCQKNAINAGPFHAPRTRLGLFARNAFYRAMTSPLLAKQFEKMVNASASAFELPAYGDPA